MESEGTSSHTPEDDDIPVMLAAVEPDQKPSDRRGRTSGRPATRRSPQVRQRNEPKTWLAYLSTLTDDWQRTLRFLAILVTVGTCIAGIVYICQLNDEPWLELIGCVAAIVTFKIRRRSEREGAIPGPVLQKGQQIH
jgi:hypothetical protein